MAKKPKFSLLTDEQKAFIEGLIKQLNEKKKALQKQGKAPDKARSNATFGTVLQKAAREYDNALSDNRLSYEAAVDNLNDVLNTMSTSVHDGITLADFASKFDEAKKQDPKGTVFPEATPAKK